MKKNEPEPEATGSPAHTKSTVCYKCSYVVVIIINVIAIITITIASGYTIYLAIVENKGIILSTHPSIIWFRMIYFEVKNMEIGHAALCTFGVVALVCSTLFPVKATWAKWVHGTMGLLGTLLIIIGIIIQIINRKAGNQDVEHFISYHSNFGLVSGLFMIVVVVLGFLLLGGATCCSENVMDIFHYLCGVISCILAACTFAFAIEQPWFTYSSTEKERTMMYGLIIFTIVWCAIVGTVKFIIKLRTPS